MIAFVICVCIMTTSLGGGLYMLAGGDRKLGAFCASVSIVILMFLVGALYNKMANQFLLEALRTYM